MKKNMVSFANFICRFGDEKVLLDYAKEIVIPAFTDDKFVRSFRSTHYFFYNASLVELDDGDKPVLGIAGQFVKETELTREQIFDDEKGLIPDVSSIRSAPSAFFVLVLNNHRLIYFPETAHAPDHKVFKSTAEHFIRKKYKDFIDSQHGVSVSEGNKITKKKLREIHPEPTLEVVPISGGEEISEFVRRYSKLQKIDFKIYKPNDEFDAEEVFSHVRDFTGPMGPTGTTLSLTNAEGMDIENTVSRVQDATKTANQEIRLSGKDEYGNKLTGDNQQFSILAEMDVKPNTKKGLINKLYSMFTGAVDENVIVIGKFSDEVDQKISRLIDDDK